MTEPDKRGKFLPAFPDRTIISPITDDASILTRAGFTDRLPGLMRDLNTVLGRTSVGTRLKSEPTVLSYTLGTNVNAPTFTRGATYETGPKINLKVFPQNKYLRRLTDAEGVARTTLEISGGKGHDDSIASAMLDDLQTFVRSAFPEGRAKLLLKDESGRETIVDTDLDTLTEDELNEMPIIDPERPEDGELYWLMIQTPQGRFVDFATMGLDVIWNYKGKVVTEVAPGAGEVKFVKQKRTFNIQALAYDSEVFRASGEEVERILEAFKELAVQNPYLHMYLPQEVANATDGLV